MSIKRSVQLCALSCICSAHPVSVLSDPVEAESAKAIVVQAAHTLGKQSSYRWETIIKVPEGTRFAPGPIRGKRGDDGVVHVISGEGQFATEAVIAGERTAVVDREGKWQLLANLESGQGFGRFIASRVRSIKVPEAEALEMTEFVDDLQLIDGVYCEELSEDEAKELATASSRSRFGSGRRGRGPSEVVFAKATQKYWVKDGVLVKFEQFLDASIDRGGTEQIVERTTTTTISEIGVTKHDAPEAALALLGDDGLFEALLKKP